MLIVASSVVVLVLLLIAISGIRYIPNDRVGVVENRWSLRGSVKSGFIALGGEADTSPTCCAAECITSHHSSTACTRCPS